MDNTKRIIEFICIVAILMQPINAETNETNVTYSASIDQDYGFYRVIDITTHKPAPYENKTLTINVGDTVQWINYADPDEPLTIINKEGLWGNRSAYLRWNYQKFSYTFNESGTYEIYIKEYPREQHQTIIVNPIGPITTVVQTPIKTDYPNTTVDDTYPKETVPVDTSDKNQYLTVVGLLIIAAGLITYAIYELRKRKNKQG